MDQRTTLRDWQVNTSNVRFAFIMLYHSTTSQDYVVGSFSSLHRYPMKDYDLRAAPVNVLMHFNVRTSHTRTVPSYEHVASKLGS